MFTAPGAAFRQQMLTGVASGASQPRQTRGYSQRTVYITATDAISDGTLIVEEASWDDQTGVPYGGTWSQIASYTLSSVFPSAGGQYSDHLPVSNYAFIRCRVGTSVVGAMIDVALEVS